jgi:hypothetical protein
VNSFRPLASFKIIDDKKILSMYSLFFTQVSNKVITMRTFIAVDQHGNTVTVSAYTETDARQKANDFLGAGNVIKFEEI